MIVDSCRLMTEKFRESVIIEDPSLTKTFILLPSKFLLYFGRGLRSMSDLEDTLNDHIVSRYDIIIANMKASPLWLLDENKTVSVTYPLCIEQGLRVSYPLLLNAQSLGMKGSSSFVMLPLSTGDTSKPMVLKMDQLCESQAKTNVRKICSEGNR